MKENENGNEKKKERKTTSRPQLMSVGRGPSISGGVEGPDAEMEVEG